MQSFLKSFLGQVLSVPCSRASLLWLTTHDPPASSGPQHKHSTAVDQNSDISRPCVCSRNPSAYRSLVVFLPSLMEAHPSHLSSTQYSKGPYVDFGVFSPGSSLLPDTLTLKFHTPHSSKIPLSPPVLRLSFSSLLCNLGSAPKRIDQMNIRFTLFISFLMNHSPALPVV